MKSSFRITALATLVAALASLSPAMHAQKTLSGSINVPFSFDYGTKHFAPGAYTFTMHSPDCLIVRGSKDGAMASVWTAWEPTQHGISQVIFRKYGNRYYLAEVLIASADERITVNESDAERRASREFAMRGSEAIQVALALVPERALGD